MDYTLIFPWIGVIGIAVFLLIETRIPQREWRLPRYQHWIINLSLSLCNLIIVDQCFVKIMHSTSLFHHLDKINVYERMGLNSLSRIILSILLFDLLMYAWHRLNHKLPLLWRFHRVHHTDLDLDVTSASRFHFGETTMAAVLTYSLMLSLGATFGEVRIFKLIFVLMTEFQHSNIRLSKSLEKVIWLILVPPAMHRVHHSDKQEETDSNFGAIFSFWDRLFGTFKKVEDQDRIVFGLKEYKDPKKLTILKLLMLPFKK